MPFTTALLRCVCNVCVSECLLAYMLVRVYIYVLYSSLLVAKQKNELFTLSKNRLIHLVFLYTFYYITLFRDGFANRIRMCECECMSVYIYLGMLLLLLWHGLCKILEFSI